MSFSKLQLDMLVRKSVFHFHLKKNVLYTDQLGRRNRSYQPSHANRQNPDMHSPLAHVFTKILLT